MGRRILPTERDDAIEEIVRRLSVGESMATICAASHMPDRATVRHWCDADPALATRIMDAREIGFHDRAERAVQAAKDATDPQLGRLAFDAERWFLGKLSIAFAERPPRIDTQINTQVNLDAGSAFSRFADLVDLAAARVSSGAGSTILVAHSGEAGSGGTGRGLDDLADPGGQGMGQDADGG